MQDNQNAVPLTSPAGPTPASFAAPPAATGPGGWRPPVWLLVLLVLLASADAIGSALLWQRIGQLQSDVAHRSADSNNQSIEARTLSQQAQTLSLDNAARLGVLENQVKDLGLQRAQLETLVNQITRTQDGNLVAEINASVRLAQQQMELTGSTEPVLTALNRARARLEQAGQPQLGSLQRAITSDIERLQSADTVDVLGIQKRMDDMLRWADDMPLLNHVTDVGRSPSTPALPMGEGGDGWKAWWTAIWDDLRQLVRVTRLDRPEAALVAPDQAFFLRENLKLRLLHARVDLAARHYGQARSELAVVTDLTTRYFDPAARVTQQVRAALEQTQADVRDVQPPRIDETLAALAAVSAAHP
ncbi:MAG: Protein HemX [Paracidovorax wautersii]|uniref:Protein HemX n=1 Tax=Paracidovorax wautersii TaxID=1177982 RepID=A0A7V8FKY6_9BURK|nr:MAG: Protein HemX [Paracidovorax wautersii]